MLRRILICGLCLSLAWMAALPLSVCALAANLPADCAEPPISSSSHDCGEMAMQAAHPALAVETGDSCCAKTAAPVPESLAGGVKFVPPALASPALDGDDATALPAESRHTELARFRLQASPSDLHSLFCVFLI
jgi:hypothetical protein